MERERKVSPNLRKVNRGTSEAVKRGVEGWLRQGWERIRFLSTIRFPLNFTEVYKTIFKRHEIKKKKEKKTHTHK